MAGVLDSFGVSLKAYTDVDKPSLDRAQKTIGDTLGKKTSTAGVDQADKRIAGVTTGTQSWAKRIADVRQQLKVDWHLNGLGKAVDRFRDAKEAAREFHDQAEKTSRLFGPAGGALFGLAGLGGIGMALERFATRSQELSNTAGTVGVSTALLQRTRGAAGLMGLDPAAATSALGGLQQSLFGAQWGINATALGAANRLGLNVYEDSGLFMKHLADKIKGQAPQVQREIAEAFGVQDLLPLLRKGSEAIDEYNQAASRHHELSDQQIRDGDALDRAYNDATQSTLGFADAISAHLGPSLTPILTSYSTWLDDLKKSPAALDGVGKGVEVLAGLVGVTLFSAFLKLTGAMTSWWALPAMKFLTGPGGAALGMVAGGYGTAGMINSISGSDPSIGQSLLPILSGGPAGALFGFGQLLHRIFGPKQAAIGPGGRQSSNTAWIPGKPSAGDPRGMIPVIRAAAAKYGIDPDTAVRAAQSEGLGTFTGDQGTSFTAFQLHRGGNSLGDQFFNETGRDPSNPNNEPLAIDWAMRNLARTGWGPYHRARRVGIGDREGIGEPPPATIAGAPLDIQGLTNGDDLVAGRREKSVWEQLNTLQTGTREWPIGPAAVTDYVPPSDSHHSVEIIAPPGFSAAKRMSRGVADLTLRTQTAFSSP